MDTIRVGVVGMGVMGVTHAKIYKALPQVQLVGLVEPDQGRGEAAANTLGVPCYQTLEELMRQDIQAVSVCTPDDMHKEFILKAFQNKVKVLTEKPLETSVQKCDEIIAARPDSTYLMVGHTLRFDPRLIPFKKMLQAGELGKVISISAKRSNPAFIRDRISPRSSITWFLGIHDIDMILWLTGDRVKRVHAFGNKPFTNNWDYVASILEFESGAVGVMENHWVIPNERPLVSDASVTILGEKGMLEANLNGIESIATIVGKGQFYNDIHYQPEDMSGVPHGDMYWELQAFIDAVRNNETPPVTAEQAREAVRVIEEIEKLINL